MEKIDYNSLRFRMLSYLDFQEFKRAALESIPTNEPFLVYGSIFNNVTVLDFVTIYMNMMKDTKVDHYGLFSGSTLLAHAQYEYGLGPHGTELIGWTRNEYQNKRIGEYGLAVATNNAFINKKFNYVELKIDSKNEQSRRIAEKVGFKPYLRLKYESGGESNFIYYIKFNPLIESLGRRYRKRPIDIMNSPASKPPLHHFLRSPRVSDFYDWPFPDYQEEANPVSLNLISAYLALVNFHPDELKNEMYS